MSLLPLVTCHHQQREAAHHVPEWTFQGEQIAKLQVVEPGSGKQLDFDVKETSYKHFDVCGEELLATVHGVRLDHYASVEDFLAGRIRSVSKDDPDSSRPFVLGNPIAHSGFCGLSNDPSRDKLQLKLPSLDARASLMSSAHAVQSALRDLVDGGGMLAARGGPGSDYALLIDSELLMLQGQLKGSLFLKEAMLGWERDESENLFTWTEKCSLPGMGAHSHSGPAWNANAPGYHPDLHFSEDSVLAYWPQTDLLEGFNPEGTKHVYPHERLFDYGLKNNWPRGVHRGVIAIEGSRLFLSVNNPLRIYELNLDEVFADDKQPAIRPLCTLMDVESNEFPKLLYYDGHLLLHNTLAKYLLVIPIKDPS